MRLLIAAALLFLGSQNALAQSSTKLKLDKVSPANEVVWGNTKANLIFNSSRLAGSGLGDQTKLRSTSFEALREFRYRGMNLETGLGYETLGGKFNDGTFSTEIEVSYLTIPLMAQVRMGRVMGMDLVGSYGGRFAVLSQAEAKAKSDIFFPVVLDLEDDIEEVDLRAAVGLSLVGKSPKTLGFNTGVRWQRGILDVAEGPGPKLVHDSIDFSVGVIF